MKQNIIVINGGGRSGKDTFVNMVREQYPTIRYGIIDPIKDIARRCGWKGGKTEKDRKFLSDLKILLSQYNDYPFQCVRDVVKRFRESNALFLFLMLREPDEIQRAVEEFGATTLLIQRPGIEQFSNMADENVERYKYDIVVENDASLSELNLRSIEILKLLLK